MGIQRPVQTVAWAIVCLLAGGALWLARPASVRPSGAVTPAASTRAAVNPRQP